MLQVQNQMSNMSLGGSQAAMSGGYQQPGMVAAGGPAGNTSGWGSNPPTGQTLSTNLWQW